MIEPILPLTVVKIKASSILRHPARHPDSPNGPCAMPPADDMFIVLVRFAEEVDLFEEIIISSIIHSIPFQLNSTKYINSAKNYGWRNKVIRVKYPTAFLL